MKTNKVVVVIAFLLAAGVGFAQGARGMGGGGISGQPIDGTVIKPRSVQASGTQDQFMCTSTTAVCEVESSISAATMTSTVPAFDIGPTATPGANDRLACFSYGATGSKTRVACVDAEGDMTANALNIGTTTSQARLHVLTTTTDFGPNSYGLGHAVFGTNSLASGGGAVYLSYNTSANEGIIGALDPSNAWRALTLSASEWKFRQNGGATPIANITGTGAFNSAAASGNQAYTCTNTGCRLSLGNTGRYLVDDGSRLSSPSAIASSDFTKNDFNNLILTGRREDSASSVGIIMRNSFALTTAGSKLVSFRNPTTTEIASIDKDGAYTGLSCNATATSGSSFTGGNSSTSLTITSNTPDSVTSSTVPAIRLQASQNITDTDLLMSVEDSAGNRRVAISELGNGTFAGNVTAGSGVITNFFNQSGYGSRGNNAITIPDDGAGTPAAYTWQPQFAASVTYFTCNDADGCEITMSLGSSFGGVYNRAFNIGTNTVTFKDTAGLSEMAGDFAMGQWDTIEFMVVSGRFVELNRSNN